jgi:CelD/BcsL family acetyltransferase involved in cellulose biosynthesis
VADRAPTVTVHAGGIDALAPTYETLWDPSHPGAVFRSFAWQAVWWRHFRAGRTLHALVARDGDEPVGLLPLYRAPTALGPELRLLGDGVVGSDYLGLLCRPDDAPRVAAACAAALAPFPRVDLRGLARPDPLASALVGAAHAVIVDDAPCPYVRIDGPFESYLAGRPDGTGTQFRRRRRWLERQPGYRFEVHAHPKAVTHALEPFFELHAARWALDAAGSQAIDSPAVTTFHRDAARALAERGWARLYLLHVEGAPRAALYGFLCGDRFVYYQSGHEPAWRRRSVGSVLLGLVLEQAFSDGLREVDLLHGDEPYKRRWATDERRLCRVTSRGPGAWPWLRDRARAAALALRRAGRAALPPGLIDASRRVRRRAEAALRGAT